MTEARPNPAPALRLRDAEVTHGQGRSRTRALADVSLTVEPGELIAVIGSSGAGKTTLLRVLAGGQGLSAGQLEVNGIPWASIGREERRRFSAGVGFIHQDHALVPVLRVVQNVAAGRLGARGFWRGLRSVLMTPRSEAEEIYGLLDRVGVAKALYRRTDELSGGERQRVAIARALHQRPGILLADEPVASVDPVRAAEIIELLLELARERHLPLVASLHDVGLAARYFPRVIGLRNGAVLFDERAGESGRVQLGEERLRGLYEGKETSVGPGEGHG